MQSVMTKSWFARSEKHAIQSSWGCTNSECILQRWILQHIACIKSSLPVKSQRARQKGFHILLNIRASYMQGIHGLGTLNHELSPTILNWHSPARVTLNMNRFSNGTGVHRYPLISVKPRLPWSGESSLETHLNTLTRKDRQTNTQTG